MAINSQQNNQQNCAFFVKNHIFETDRYAIFHLFFLSLLASQNKIAKIKKHIQEIPNHQKTKRKAKNQQKNVKTS